MPNPIQEKINIKEIRDGVVILDDNSLRAVLLCSSINFFLKSTEEQSSLTYAYQGFLNSLDFNLQIMMVSRKLDISDYLDILMEKQKVQQNELLKIQTTEYIDFIKSLTEMANIMSQTFFAVIPFVTMEQKTDTLVNKITNIFTQKQTTKDQKQDFEQMKNQLWQRVEYISAGLNTLGVKSVPLNTEELISLYYSMYNPESKEKVKINTEKII